jgi:glyoxylase-like metal-dependent hydrolase (beta-lactamase superfamily II)
MADSLQRLEIPQSSSTVDVYIIDNGASLSGLPGSSMMDPVLPGYEEGGRVPSYAFLIHHKPTNVRLLFDLSVRTDWKSDFPPGFVNGVQRMGLEVHVGKDIADVLIENFVNPGEINAIIFSHHHFDHTGDTGRFPSSTKLLVGPGYKKAYFPGWPANPRQFETISDLYERRETIELDFSPDHPKVLSIGNFQAYDYFSDGSFFILSTPGHTIGHLSALARTTSEDGDWSTFIFMGGDIVHSNAVFRPTLKYPLPSTILAPNGRPFASHTCPSERFAQMHPLYLEPGGGMLSRTTPFSQVAGPEHNLAESQRSANKLANFDGEENILTIPAHDVSLRDVLDFFPRQANRWKEKGCKKEGHWRWLAPCMQSSDTSKL